MSQALRPGMQLNNTYVILSVLGAGGGGFTYLCRDIVLDKEYAVKEMFVPEWDGKPFMRRAGSDTADIVYPPDLEGKLTNLKAHFLEEARCLALFHSDAIVDAYSFFESNHTAYIVMEYLQGHTLEQEIKDRGRIPQEEFFDKIRPVLEALDQIHDKKVIHRDIKPGNIMCMPDGRYCLYDFGIARNLKQDTDAASYGALYYSPLEQISSQYGEQGPWTDIYAISVTAYQAITGKLPEPSTYRNLVDDLKKPSELGIEIDSSREEALLKGMAVHPQNRFQSVKELMQAIDAKPVKKKTRHKKHTWMIAAIIALALTGLLGLGGHFFFSRQQDCYRIVLTPDHTFSVSGWFDAQKTLQARCDILSGKKGSQIQVSEDEIVLSLDKKYFSDYPPEQLLRFFITRPMELYLVHSADSGYEKIKLERGDYTVKETSLPENLEKKEEDHSSRYMQIEFTEEFCASNQDFLGHYGQEYYVAQDAEGYDIWCSFTTYPWEKGCICALDPGYEELTLYNVTHPTLETSFTFQITHEINWLTDDNRYGKNQVSVDQLTGKNVTAIIQVAAAGRELTDADLMNVYQNFSERMDVLDCSYAIGEMDPMTATSNYADAAEYRYVAVRFAEDTVDPTLIDLLICPKSDMKLLDAANATFYPIKDVTLSEKEGQTVLKPEIKAPGTAIEDTLPIWQEDPFLKLALENRTGYYLCYGVPHTALLMSNSQTNDGLPTDTEELLLDHHPNETPLAPKDNTTLQFIQTCIQHDLWGDYYYKPYALD